MYRNTPRSNGGPEYDLLPSSEWGSGRVQGFTQGRWFKRRRTLFIFAALVASSVLVFYWLVYYNDVPKGVRPDPEPEELALPPLYPEYHHAELQLAHHDRRNPFAGGRKYMWVADHTQCER